MAAVYHDFSDEALMERIKNGDGSAFDALYERYSKRLLHYFYRMLGRNEQKSQDFLQDIFLKIVDKPHLFDVRQKFSTWIFTIASNMCKNEYRRLKVRENGSIYLGDFNTTAADVVMPVIDKHIDGKHFKEKLDEEVQQLDEHKRDTFLMRYQQHLSIKQISEAMNCSEGTVKSRLFYTTKQLAEKLQIFNPSAKSGT